MEGPEVDGGAEASFVLVTPSRIEDGVAGPPPVAQCRMCSLPPKYRRELERLRFEGKGGVPVAMAVVAKTLNAMLREDGVDTRVSREGLYRHLRAHTEVTRRTSHALQVAVATKGSLVAPPGTPKPVFDEVPAALDRSLPASQIPERLSALIDSSEQLLSMIELIIAGEVDKPPMTIREAVAAHTYVTSALRGHYWMLNRVCDPRQLVTKFLFRVLRTMQRESIESAKRVFSSMAKDCALEPDADRWEDWAVQHGLEFVNELDTIARRCDTELLHLVSEECGSG